MYIFTIFKKELLDIIRDRRSVMTMILLPLLMMPLLMGFMGKFMASQKQKSEDKTLKVAVIDNNNGKDFIERLDINQKMDIVRGITEEDMGQLIKDDSLDLGVVIASNFDQLIADNKTGNIKVYYNSTSIGIKERLDIMVDSHNDRILDSRLQKLGLDEAVIKPIKVEENNVYTVAETVGKMAGGILPYMFVLFCFFGCMYPAIDLFAGEKERGTLETILSTPVNRFQLLIGKLLVVTLGGAISGTLAIIGLAISGQITDALPPMMANMVAGILSPSNILMFVLMLIPLAMFFASMIIMLSIYAKSYKEAQSLIMPSQFVVFVPLILGMLPGIKLNIFTAMVPILNVALTSKEIAAGTIDPVLFIVTIVSMIVIALLGIYLCTFWFDKESNILRT